MDFVYVGLRRQRGVMDAKEEVEEAVDGERKPVRRRAEDDVSMTQLAKLAHKFLTIESSGQVRRNWIYKIFNIRKIKTFSKI